MRSRFLHLACLTALLFLGGKSYSQTITIAASPGTTICHGVSDTFTATTTGAAGYAFKWEKNAATIPGATTNTYITATLVNGDSVRCVLVDLAGDSVVSNTLHMIIDSLPVIMPITGPDSVCAGSTAMLADATTGGVWSSTNPPAATVSAAGLVTGIAPAAPGSPTLRIVYKVTNGCGTDSIRLRFRVNTPAGPIIGPTTVCMDSFAFFTDTARMGVWSTSDSTIAGFAPFPPGLMQGMTPGTVTVYFNAVNACGAATETAMLQVVNCDSAAAVPLTSSIGSALHIFPNPSTGSFALSLDGHYTSANCIISNMIGEPIKEVAISSGKQTDVALNIPPGIYFIAVLAGDEKYISKIVVQ